MVQCGGNSVGISGQGSCSNIVRISMNAIESRGRDNILINWGLIQW